MTESDLSLQKGKFSREPFGEIGMSETHQNDYDLVSAFYDQASQLYSGGQIRASKLVQIEAIGSGDRVLYAGVGGGEDALEAARKGADVTVVDLSAKMLAKARARFIHYGVADRIEMIHEDIMAFDGEGFDVVVANYFLNVFSPDIMPVVMAHLVRRLRPNGLFLIADFAPIRGNPLTRLAQWSYHATAVLLFRLLANNSDHPIYDYPELFGKYGLDLEQVRYFPVWGIGPAWYRSLFARKTHRPLM